MRLWIIHFEWKSINIKMFSATIFAIWLTLNAFTVSIMMIRNESSRRKNGGKKQNVFNFFIICVCEKELSSALHLLSNALSLGKLENRFKIELIDVKCDKNEDGMHVTVEFSQPFEGVIYSQGFFNDPECRYFLLLQFWFEWLNNKMNSGRISFEFSVNSSTLADMFQRVRVISPTILSYHMKDAVVNHRVQFVIQLITF